MCVASIIDGLGSLKLKVSDKSELHSNSAFVGKLVARAARAKGSQITAQDGITYLGVDASARTRWAKTLKPERARQTRSTTRSESCTSRKQGA